MRRWIFWWITTSFLFALQGHNARAQVSSARIEGVVRDKVTKALIPDAIVALHAIPRDYDYVLAPYRWHERTDDKGRFYLQEGWPRLFTQSRFILIVCKDGYLEFPPGLRTFGVCGGLRIPLARQFSSTAAFEKKLGVFSLREGQVTRLVIELEKGGSLDGRILVSGPEGTSPCRDVSLIKRRDPDETFLEASKSETFFQSSECSDEGRFEFRDLYPSANYYLSLSSNDYVTDIIDGIQIERNRTTSLDRLIEHDDLTGVRGVVQVGGSPVTGGWVTLQRLPPEGNPPLRHGCRVRISTDGSYSCRGVASGPFRVDISTDVFVESSEDVLRTVRMVTIPAGQTAVLDVDIPSPPQP